MPKYYTPEIEEFHVGFEYEFQSLKGWGPCVFNQIEDGGYYSNNYSIKEHLSEDRIRVKYLDREDIESLVWVFYGDNDLEDVYLMDQGLITYKLSIITVECGSAIKITHGDRVFFNGYIKNKSELKRLMNQIDITNA